MIEESADIDPHARVQPTAVIWHLAQVRELASVGSRTTVGRGAYVGPGVHIGDDCKIQNAALLYEPAHLEDGVFIGPGAVLTNDRFPRAVTADGVLKGAQDWSPVGVRVMRGASIGAGAVCVAPVTIGRWALVAAGAVVTSDVANFALVAGNPARPVGWVGHVGVRLIQSASDENLFTCPVSDRQYRIGISGDLEALDD